MAAKTLLYSLVSFTTVAFPFLLITCIMYTPLARVWISIVSFEFAIRALITCLPVMSFIITSLFAAPIILIVPVAGLGYTDTSFIVGFVVATDNEEIFVFLTL